jgi:hypothetical protein
MRALWYSGKKEGPGGAFEFMSGFVFIQASNATRNSGLNRQRRTFLMFD